MFQNHVRKVARRGKEIVDHSVDLLHRWEDNSRHYIGTFLQLFGTEGMTLWGGAALPSPPASPNTDLRPRSPENEAVAAADWEEPKA